MGGRCVFSQRKFPDADVPITTPHSEVIATGAQSYDRWEAIRQGRTGVQSTWLVMCERDVHGAAKGDREQFI